MLAQEKKGALLCGTAAEAFRKGDFKTALTLYRQLGSILGDRLFSANIMLCQKKLEQMSTGSTQGREPALSLPVGSVAETTRPTNRLKTLRVAAIMDEFTYGSYKFECNLRQLTPNDWEQELEGFQPELLFIESAWRGKDELWGSKVGHSSQELRGIVEWCRQRGIPTVFWNKEDPVHFETFLSTAKLFDHVFTTDLDCIHRYKGALGHNRVYLLPFAAQPAVNNPIETYDRKDAFCFAGAYYVKYPDRINDLNNFLTYLPTFRLIEIFDRNHGKNDPNYAFPDDYKPYIVGTLPYDQIDKAYKGYRYAINLNSVKQSQTMFARRVFELLACNTLTVSNFSRGVRLLFQDLVVTTDSGQEAMRRLQKLAANETQARKLRLAGLRKVMGEHTYQDRLCHVVSKALAIDNLVDLHPPVLVVSYANSAEGAQCVVEQYCKQRYPHKRLLLVVPGGFESGLLGTLPDVQIMSGPAVANLTWSDLAKPTEWLAPMVAEDHYGPHYLTDMALATRYAPGPVIGKAGHYVWSADAGSWLKDRDVTYTKVPAVHARSALIQSQMLATTPVRYFIVSLHTARFEHPEALSLDEFNYCRNTGLNGLSPEDQAEIDDLDQLLEGVGLEELIQRAEQIQPLAEENNSPAISATELASMFAKRPTHSPVQLSMVNGRLRIQSTMSDGKHEYVYATRDLDVGPLNLKIDSLRFYMETSPGLNLQLVWLFLDAKGNKLGHVVKVGNRNHQVDMPPSTAKLRVGLRIYGPGESDVKALQLAHRSLEPAELITHGEHLLLTNHYPSYDDLYRNGFVHSRVTAYRERGLNVDVFRLRTDQPTSYHEYQNTDVVTGSQTALHRMLSTGRYKTVLVHFLDPAMWAVLSQHIDRVRVVVWVHGAEIQPYHRRAYNYETEQERQVAQSQSDARMAFWRGLLQPMPLGLKLVFVSRYFAEEVMEDLGFRIPEGQYEVIHNPIDTELFAHHEKPAAQRKKILSIRPYASRTYANDLSTQVILSLSTQPWFKDLEFRLIGDGRLFDEVLAPLRGFDNVTLERRFLSQPEIAALHREYGVFLCPTRMDSQGVSRDEAMASGLVPVTNAVAAIPEFVDETCGVLAPRDDAEAMAEGLGRLVNEPGYFEALSRAAALRVRRQSGSDITLDRELSVIQTR